MVIVDDDIDITNEKDVLWAICRRADIDNMQVIKGIMTKAGSPKKAGGPLVNDRIIIDACWPYEKKERYPVIHRFGPEIREKMMKKFSSLFK
jgi:4-hydroxy-3-polyprenylbenzoate decarboxylase